MSIDPVHEALHQPLDGSRWHDVVSFSLRSANDDEAAIDIEAFIDVQLGEPSLLSSIIITVDGDQIVDRQRFFDDTPQADWDVMSVGGVTFRIHEMLVEWLVQVAMGDVKAYLVCRASDEGDVIGRPLRPEGGGYRHRVSVTGDLMIGEQRWVIDGVGSRTRWWGHHEPTDTIRSLKVSTPT
jgi:hypothetical protein